MNLEHPLALLNLLNLLIIPLGFLIRQLAAQINALEHRIRCLERDAITRGEVAFWRGQRTAEVPPIRREK